MPDCKTITRHQCSELMSYLTQLTIILYPIGTSYLPNGVWTAKTGEPVGTHRSLTLLTGGLSNL